MTASTAKVVSLAILLSALVVTVFAGFFAPYDPTEQNRAFPYAPPASWRISTPDVPGNRAGADETATDRRKVRWLVNGTSYKIAGVIPGRLHLFGAAEPARVFLLGTDGLGRDEFSRLVYGGQVTLLSGLLGTAIALALATLLGTVAGYFGGWVDALLMRIVELFLAMPWIYLLFAVRAFLPLHVAPQAAFFLVASLMGFLGWAQPATLIRGVVRGAREHEFVIAARSAGAGPMHIIVRHIAPQMTSLILTQAALLIPQYMLAEVTLSFVGLGVSEQLPSWGNMLRAAQQSSVLQNDLWILSPAIVMIPIFWSFSILVDYAHERVKFDQSSPTLARQCLGT